MTELKEEVTVHEEKVVNQVENAKNQPTIQLTKKNAYRVTAIKRMGTDKDPVSFHFRKIHSGMNSYTHLYGDKNQKKELHSSDFKELEAVAFKYPGHLEEYQEKAYDAYR